jgi:hypothetical protein
MNQTIENTPSDLGRRLGQALQRQADLQSTPAPLRLDRVHAGARRRRAISRSAVTMMSLAIIGLAGYALTLRNNQPEVATPSTAAIRPAMLPIYAVLENEDGVRLPTAMYADRGGQPYGEAIPAIDVWRRGDAILIVRTNRDASFGADEPVASEAPTAVDDGGGEPWIDRTVTKMLIRGNPGALQELATDQFAVWIPQGSQSQYTLVIGRGMSQSGLLATVEGLVEINGILEPPAEFTLVERAAAQDDAVVGPSANANYGVGEGPWISTFEPPNGRNSIETASWFDVGHLEMIDGQQVLVTEFRGQTSLRWFDHSGVAVSISQLGLGVDVPSLMRSARFVSEIGWSQIGEQVSRQAQATIDVANRGSVDGASIIYRGDEGAISALCLEVDGFEQVCAPYPNVNDLVSSAQVELNGHWFIFGFHTTNPDQPISMDDLTYTDAFGTCCDVQWNESNGASWYLVRVPDSVQALETNLGEVMGGPVGWMSRPFGAAQTF